MPKVSVIMPSYNGEKFIRTAILSVLKQTEKDIELIIVDDESTDSTPSIISEVKASDERIISYRQRHAGRPATGKNKGLELSRAEYICFLDQDDLYHPDKIKCSVRLLEANSAIDVLFHNVMHIDKNGDELKNCHSQLEHAKMRGLARYYSEKIGQGTFICSEKFYNFISLSCLTMSTTTVMFRRSILNIEKYRFPEDVQITDDAEFWWLLARGRRVLCLDRVLSYHRAHDVNLCSDLGKLFRDEIIVHLRNFKRASDLFSREELRRYKKKIAMIYYRLGCQRFSLFRVSEAKSNYDDSLKWHFNIKVFAADIAASIIQYVIPVFDIIKRVLLRRGKAL